MRNRCQFADAIFQDGERPAGQCRRGFFANTRGTLLQIKPLRMRVGRQDDPHAESQSAGKPDGVVPQTLASPFPMYSSILSGAIGMRLQKARMFSPSSST